MISEKKGEVCSFREINRVPGDAKFASAKAQWTNEAQEGRERC